MKDKVPHHWLEPCSKCGKKHLCREGTCPGCGLTEVSRHVSEKVCYRDESCDGCQAYRDHQR